MKTKPNMKFNGVLCKLLSCSSAMLFVACAELELEKKPAYLDLSDEVLQFEEILVLTEDLTVVKGDLAAKRIDQKVAEAQIKVVMEPLIDNGRHLQSLMLNSLNHSGEISKLSFAEKSNLSNLDEKELADLAFLMSYTHTASIDPRLRSCLSAAVGVAAIYDLIENTAALGRVQTTIGALKLIGRRYLGWIGVGLMVADFADCYVL